MPLKYDGNAQKIRRLILISSAPMFHARFTNAIKATADWKKMGGIQESTFLMQDARKLKTASNCYLIKRDSLTENVLTTISFGRSDSRS